MAQIAVLKVAITQGAMDQKAFITLRQVNEVFVNLSQSFNPSDYALAYFGILGLTLLLKSWILIPKLM